MTTILDGVDISPYIYINAIKPGGGGFDSTGLSLSRFAMSPLSRKGRKARSYRFDLRFLAELDRNTIRKAVAQLEEGDWFVPLDDGFGHRLPAESVALLQQAPKGVASNRILDYLLAVDLEDPYLYDVDRQGGEIVIMTESGEDLYTETGKELIWLGSLSVENNWAPVLDTFSGYKTNGGDRPAPAVWSCRVVAGFATYHLSDLTLGVYDGSTLVEDLVLADELLTGEVLELLQVGALWRIVQTYEDGFTSGTNFGNDKYSSVSASVAGGKLEISASGSAVYYLGGVHPIIRGEGLVVSFVPVTTGAGVASFEVSLDGVSWETVIDSTDTSWTEGALLDVDVPQAAGRLEVYVRWACDASVSLSIDDLSIVQNRHVSTSLIPMIAVGDERRIKFFDGPTSSNSATIEATFRRSFEV